MDLIETYHYFEVAMDKIGEQSKGAWQEHGKSSAEEYARSFRDRSIELTEKMTGFTFDDDGVASNTGMKSLGMDPDLVMQYQAQYAQMADSIGMSGEAALATSEAMTMLAGDWSSLRNIDFEDSFQKMASALAGQSRAVRALGIDITQAALQQTAYNIGLTTSVANMDQATKAELRMIAILDQSRVAWGDLAATINTPANQLRMIQQNFISLTRTIGNIFLPVVAKVLPYVNGLVIALQRLAEWIAGFLGADLKKVVTSSGGLNNDILGDIAEGADNATDSIGDTDKAVQKLKRTILGFDELNVLNDNSASDSSNGKTSGIGGLGAGEQALLDASLNDLLAEYKKVWDKAFEDMNSKAEEFAMKLQEIAKQIHDFVTAGEFEKLGAYLASGINFVLDKASEAINADKVLGKLYPVIDGITRTFNSLVDNVNFGRIGQIIADGINIITGSISRLVSGVDWVNLGSQVANGFNVILAQVNWTKIGEGFVWRFRLAWGMLKGFVMGTNGSGGIDAEGLGNALGTAFDGAMNAVPWTDIGKTLNTGFTKIWKAFREFVTDEVRFKNLGANFATLLNNALSVESLTTAGQAIAGAFNALFNTIDGFLNGSTVKKTGVHWDETIGAMVNGSYVKKTGGFDFNKLKNSLVAGLNSIFENIDLSHAEQVLSKAIDGVLKVLTGIGEEVNWANIGYKIGQAFKDSAKNWGKWFRQGVKIIKDILGELLKGIAGGLFGEFGENFAKGFVDGIQSIIDLNEEVVKTIAEALKELGKALNKLDPIFVQDLGTALGVFFGIKISASMVSHLGGVVENLLKLFGLFGGKAAAGAAGSAAAGGAAVGGAGLFGKIKSMIPEGVLSGVTSGVKAGAWFTLPVIMADGVQRWAEKTQGLNGVLTEEGTVLQDVFRHMTDIGQLLPEQNEELVKLIDSCENSGMSMEETMKVVVDKLKEYGLSQEQAVTAAYNAVTVQGGAFHEFLKESQRLGEGASKAIQGTAISFQGTGVTVKDVCTAMSTAFNEMADSQNEEIESLRQSWPLWIQDIQYGSGNAQEAFNGMINKLSGLRDEGIISQETFDAFVSLIGTTFPDAVITGSNKAVTALGSLSGSAKTKYGEINSSIQGVIQRLFGIGPAAEDADSKSKSFQAKLKGWLSPLSGVLTGLSLWATGSGVEGVGTKSEDAKPKVEDFNTVVESFDKDDKGKDSIGDIKLGLEDVGTASGDLLPVVDENLFKLEASVEKGANDVKVDAETMGKNLSLGFADGVKKEESTATGATSDVMNDTIRAAKDALDVNSPSRVFSDIGRNVIVGLSDGVNNNAYIAITAMESMANSIKRPFEGVAREIASMFSNLGANISRAAGDLYWVGANMSASLANGFSSRRIVLPHFGWNFNRITYGNGGWFDLPNIWVNWYAKGGVFTDPTIAGFGEAGNEAALPLTNKHTMAMVSDAIVNSGGALSNGMTRDDVIEAVATGVAMAMGQNPQTVEVVVNSVLKTSDEKLAQSVSRGQARLNQRYNVAY